MLYFNFDYIGAEFQYFEIDMSNKNIVPYWKFCLLSRSSLQLQADLMTINTVSHSGGLFIWHLSSGLASPNGS